MKKQILFLSFLVLAVLASVTNSYGQYTDYLTGAPVCIDPTEVTCLTSDALHPVAGTSYTYEVDVPTPTSGTNSFYWYVTQEQTFINTSGLYTTNAKTIGDAFILDAGSHINTASSNESINITWKSFTFNPSQPLFVVIYVQNTDACTTDNLKVYKIEPQNSFTLDLANLTNAGGSASDAYETCVSPVAGASYNPLSGNVDMDFGVNYMYFIVNAANWTGAWRPSFELTPSLTGSSRTLAVEWAYPTQAATSGGTWTQMTNSSGNEWTNTTTLVEPQGGTDAVGENGECIIVRVTVDHNNDETIEDETFTLAVDGVTMTESVPGTSGFDTVGQGDIHYQAGTNTPAEDCPWVDGYTNDVITQVITQRPEVEEVDPAAPAFLDIE